MGFRYCDLLLSQGKVAEVQSRADYALKIVLQGSRNLLDIALNHLSFGRAHLLQETFRVSETLKVCTTYLDRAVDGFRQAGDQEYIGRGLLARAELRRVTGELDKARRDLDEAFSIASRGGMRLFEADCHLAYARLYFAEHNLAKVSNLCKAKEANGKARENLAKARQIIEQTGYHRWDGEAQELEAQV